MVGLVRRNKRGVSANSSHSPFSPHCTRHNKYCVTIFCKQQHLMKALCSTVTFAREDASYGLGATSLTVKKRDNKKNGLAGIA